MAQEEGPENSVTTGAPSLYHLECARSINPVVVAALVATDDEIEMDLLPSVTPTAPDYWPTELRPTTNNIGLQRKSQKPPRLYPHLIN